MIDPRRVRAGVEQAKCEGRFLLIVIVIAIFGGLLIVQPLQRLCDGGFFKSHTEGSAK
jgi:hypothetical protein